MNKSPWLGVMAKCRRPVGKGCAGDTIRADERENRRVEREDAVRVGEDY
jgi:hypothetical protein